ncbi:MAG TPA: DUF6293 family protein, partial [Candidatus Acidoferrum sp.]|nr:DUF6293 family protein [Candidatus Acidoferrum sp.]
NFKQHVHIIPLGFEIDRAVVLLEKLPANRVYLLVTPEDPDYPDEKKEQLHYVNEVTRKLREKKIEVIMKEVDCFDIKQLMNSVSSLILEEKSKGNVVYVNMSAGGRLSSVGATLAAMAHNAEVYYASASEYSKNDSDRQLHGLSICNKSEGMIIENFQIKLPDDAGKIVLTSIWRKGKKMNTEEILETLVAKGVEIFADEKKFRSKEEQRRLQQKNRVNLNKAVLNKLEKDGYILREKSGRFNKISLTESGEYMANIIGTTN